MKLKTRLIIAFLTVILIPVLLTFLMVCGLSRYQINSIEKTYEITGTTVKSFANSMQVLSRLTEKPYHELEDMVEEDAEQLEDATCLEKFNKKLEKKKAYLLVRKGTTIIYMGTDIDNANHVIPQLPAYGESGNTSENGVYLGGEAQALVKQVDFSYEDGEQGSAFIITDVSNMIPEVQEFIVDMVMGILIVLVLTALLLIFWIYRAVMQPLGKMQNAAQNIKEGNLDFELRPESDDELGRLCRDLEEMRKRLKDNAEEKVAFDKESKELISNISHDLKTPVTAIKGYAEGIMDGVADTPEKMDKYIRTIYNKANEMDLLINELTLYSKIDTNRIPYNFNTLSVNEYFNDCAEDLSLEMESKNVEFGYFNYVARGVQVIADAEQIKRVIHNIVNNSLKYMDKSKGKINLRVKDVGDFIQVEIEDNGKGIAAKDLPNIFDRFYRTDASRNSSKGGSGIGLSIVKKIIEEHGGKIWATSREDTGTTMYFVLRKYQEVPIHE
ncbi:HAMP domain-containing sensor histidine kinase [Dorea sp. D27]|uniref:HAMP domain-containing sensor histidine kinase n=1 Tax=Dorea sp. D27 TaxID=658665 RepID=UPI0006733DF7|nr:HAMP domain-containing sensor histidine kinase [Dorea sp. D27]KMZ54408.1 sensor histidine kinase [Dorea sp. D27]